MPASEIIRSVRLELQAAGDLDRAARLSGAEIEVKRLERTIAEIAAQTREELEIQEAADGTLPARAEGRMQ